MNPGNTGNTSEEGLRQQRLVRVLMGDAGQQTLGPKLRDAMPRAALGLQAYAANAGALAERALRAAYSTVAQLVGAAAFAALARALWRAHPPVRGDVAQWGAVLPGFIAADPQLADEPYLADVARLDWAVHCTEQAADTTVATAGLALLASADPAALWLHLAPGTTLHSSAYPAATIWLAHQSSAIGRFAPARTALACGLSEHALVWRDGYKGQVTLLPEAAADFTRAVLAGHTLGQSLDLAGPPFLFEPWLLSALQQGWLTTAAPCPPPLSGDAD